MTAIRYTNISLELWGSVLSLVVAICILLSSDAKTKLNRLFLRLLLCNIIILLSDAAAWFFKGQTNPVNVYMVHLANFLVFAFGYILLAAFTDYLTSYIAQKTAISTKPAKIVRGLCTIAVAMVVVNLFNHMYYLIDTNNLYQRQNLFWLSQIWGIFCMLINAGILLHHRKSLSRKEITALSSYIILPVAAMSVQMFLYGIALLYIATTVSLLAIYIGIQIEQARTHKEELAQSRIAVMLSQIQPHFLFNTLTAISRLCDTDSQRAKTAILQFSSYLRGNLESLSQQTLVPFEQELGHVQIYLSLEKMRFGDKLNIVYQIEATHFLLPALTVQPIVENAVRHGVGKKEQGGTVTLSTKETEQFIQIIIHDDGAGFVPESPNQTDRRHIGMQNVSTRLAAQSGGTLSVESSPDQGTTAVIQLPNKPIKNE